MNIKGLVLSKNEFKIDEMEWGSLEDADAFDRLLKLFEKLVNT